MELGFVQSTSDACIYVKGNASNLCVVAVYVDDLIIGCASDREIEEIKSAFCNRFEMKDLGKLDYFLGVNIVQNVGAGEVFINQSTYVRSLLEKFNFTDAKPVKTPVDISAKIELMRIQRLWTKSCKSLQ